MSKVHYSGGMAIYTKNRLTWKLPGWPVCGCGISRNRLTAGTEHTDELHEVTCGKCKAMIKRERAGIVFAAGKDLEFLKDKYGLEEIAKPKDGSS